MTEQEREKTTEGRDWEATKFVANRSAFGAEILTRQDLGREVVSEIKTRYWEALKNLAEERG